MYTDPYSYSFFLLVNGGDKVHLHDCEYESENSPLPSLLHFQKHLPICLCLYMYLSIRPLKTDYSYVLNFTFYVESKLNYIRKLKSKNLEF